MHKEYQYMVDFTLPSVLSEDFLRLIPQQRSKVNKLFREGRIINYALALDDAKMWAVLNANDVEEVNQIIGELPLSPFMHFHVRMLTYFNSVGAESPIFSMN